MNIGIEYILNNESFTHPFYTKEEYLYIYAAKCILDTIDCYYWNKQIINDKI
jgi:hypothetical protein